MAYTLGEAARAAGVSKTSIRRALDNGRISGTKNDLGQWCIEPAELHRVFPAVGSVPVPAEPAPVTAEQLTALERENALLREQLARERQIAEDLARDRDAWREQVQRLLPPPRQPWWRWWRR